MVRPHSFSAVYRRVSRVKLKHRFGGWGQNCMRKEQMWSREIALRTKQKSHWKYHDAWTHQKRKWWSRGDWKSEQKLNFQIYNNWPLRPYVTNNSLMVTDRPDVSNIFIQSMKFTNFYKHNMNRRWWRTPEGDAQRSRKESSGCSEQKDLVLSHMLNPSVVFWSNLSHLQLTSPVCHKPVIKHILRIFN